MNGVTARDPRRMKFTPWQRTSSLPGLAGLLLLHIIIVADAACRDGPSVSGGASCAQRIPATPSRLQTEWKMEATAHIASLVIRQMYCKLEGGAPCGNVGTSGEKLGSLKDWASKDEGWERILSSLSLYELAKRFWQQEDYDRALVAVEQSIALKLFPYSTVAQLERWQRNLVGPGSQFVRQKNELADALMLKADCLLELGQNEKGDVQMLEQAMQALELASALMNSSSEAAPDLMANMKTLAAQLASAAAEMLPKLRIPKLHELMDKYSITCEGCVEKQQLLGVLVAKLRLPVVVVAATGRVEPREDPLATPPAFHMWQPGDSAEQPVVRMLSQLLSLVHTRFLEDLQVPCTGVDRSGACTSHLPEWLSSADRRAHSDQGADEGTDQGSGPTVGAGGEGSCGRDSQGRSGEGAGGGGSDGEGGAAHGRVCSGALSGSTQERNRCGGNEMAGDGRESSQDVPVRSGRRSGSGADSCNGSKTDSRPTYTYVADMGALIEKMLKSDLRNVQGMLRALDRITGGGSAGGVASGQNAGKVCSTPTTSASKAAGSGAPPSPPPDDLCGQPHLQGYDPIAVLSHFLNEDHDLAHEDYIPGSTHAGGTAATSAGGGTSRGTGGGAGTYRHSHSSSVSVGGVGSMDGEGGSDAGHGRGRGQGFGAGRETSDRQLQEQLAKASGSGTPDKDSPLIPITLCVFIFGIIGVCFGLKHKRRIHRFWTSHTSRATAKDPKPPTVAAVVAPSPKHVSATLRDAMASSDTAKLESAILMAESLAFDQPILQKARVALQQRKRKERERAAAASARERALRREADRRRSKANRHSSSGDTSSSNSSGSDGTQQSGGRRKGSLLSGLLRFLTMCFTSKQAVDDASEDASGHAHSSNSSANSDTCPSESPSQDSDVQPYNDTRKRLLSKSGSSRDIRGADGARGPGGRDSKQAGDDELRVSRTEDSAEAYMLLFGHLSRSESGTDSDGWQEPTHSRRKWHTSKANSAAPPTHSTASSTANATASHHPSAHNTNSAIPDPPVKLPKTKPSAPPSSSMLSPASKPVPAPITPLAVPPPSKQHGHPLSTKARLSVPQSTRTTLTPHNNTHTTAPPTQQPPAPPKPTSSWLGWLTPQATSTSASPVKPKPSASTSHTVPTRTDKHRYSTAAKSALPPSHPSSRSNPSANHTHLSKPKSSPLDPNAPPYLPPSFQPQAPRTPPNPPSAPPYSLSYSLASPTPSESPEPSSRKPNLPPLNLPSSSGYPALSAHSLEEFGIISSPEPADPYFPLAHALPTSLYNTLSIDSTTTPSFSQSLSTHSHPHPDPTFSRPAPQNPTPSESATNASHARAYSLFSPVPHDDSSPLPAILPSLLHPTPTSSYLQPLHPFPNPLSTATQPSHPTSQPPPTTSTTNGLYNMFTGGNLWTPDFSSLTSADEGAWSEAPKRLSGWRSFDHCTSSTEHFEVEEHLAATSHQVGETVLGGGSSYDLPDASEWMQEMLKHVVD